MMKTRLNRLLIMTLLLLVTILAACQSDDKENDKQDEITLVFGNTLALDEIEQADLREKFPHITFEFTEVYNIVEDLDEVVKKNAVPDILTVGSGTHFSVLVDYELDYDLTDLIEQHGFDETTISDAEMETVRKWSNGGVNYLPYIKGWDAMYYNKEIFDRFGVAYPTDGMTWDEVITLASQVNGDIDDTNYRGIDLRFTEPMLDSLHVNHVDPDTDESRYATDEKFRKYLNMLDTFARIPGIVPEDEERNWGEFIMDQTVAMLPFDGPHTYFATELEEEGMAAWDLVTYPTWSDAPMDGPLISTYGFAIAKTSAHKDQAFQVITYLLSKESQLMRSKAGFATVLNDPEVQEAFYSDIEIFKDKNVQAAFYLDGSTGPDRYSVYEEAGRLMEGWEYLRSGLDMQTYLAEITAKANDSIKEAKSSSE